ncbi:LapB repeat-containing protein, partial [Listeria monocytogenes]|uniref:LapB repeat-containing protein n=1 Tax=Listeria monocytogenes TaxID=1639 RepID=UPI0013C40B5A
QVNAAEEPISYENDATKSATDFLTDVHAAANEGSPVTSNVATVVELNGPGNYDVTLNTTDAGGNKPDPITVSVTVRETTPPGMT